MRALKHFSQHEGNKTQNLAM